jgi:hypothetical protein
MTGKHHTQSWWRLGALWRRRGGHHHQEGLFLGHLSGIVDGRDGWEHLATEQAYAQGLQEGTGIYAVLCGSRIPVASMAAPPEHRCFPCHELGGRA